MLYPVLVILVLIDLSNENPHGMFHDRVRPRNCEIESLLSALDPPNNKMELCLQPLKHPYSITTALTSKVKLFGSTGP
jgi:hypothetical protein